MFDAVLVAVILLVGAWAYQTANRLDRLHVRYDLSWQALDGVLARRAVVARAVAVDAYLALDGGFLGSEERKQRLCREIFGPTSAVVFGWIYASHQIGAGIVALAAGLVRDHYGSYTPAWVGGAVLCVVGAVLSVLIKRQPVQLSSVSP